MNNPLLLDGAMGTELFRRGLNLPLPLWSAEINITYPEYVKDVHDKYIAAGSNVITANTFRATPWAYSKAGYSPLRAKERARSSLIKAVELAKKSANDSAMVAGSLTSTEDCYLPKKFPGKTIAQDNYGITLEWLIDSDIDILLFETMGNLDEIKVAMEMSDTCNLNRWLSLILKDRNHLLDGTRLENVFDILSGYEIAVLLCNCNKFETTLDALQIYKREWLGSWGVYPNLGITDFGNNYFQILDEHKFKAGMEKILHLNPDVIGLCCGSTPKHIQLLKSYFIGNL
ncbi:MAG: hypothetical protein CMG74_04600 [Candidatus Marinimicrobia bacterium]|nr:hypothetical protein [Candidatus Neomarinimicrobiota bacterium]